MLFVSVPHCCSEMRACRTARARTTKTLIVQGALISEFEDGENSSNPVNDGETNFIELLHRDSHLPCAEGRQEKPERLGNLHTNTVARTRACDTLSVSSGNALLPWANSGASLPTAREGLNNCTHHITVRVKRAEGPRANILPEFLLQKR